MKRRAFLAASLAGTTATTGCLGSIRESVLGVDLPEYAVWVPDSGSDGFEYYDMPELEAAENASVSEYEPSNAVYSEVSSVSSGDVERVVTLEESGWLVATGSFDADAVEDELIDSEFTETGERQGYRVLEREDGMAIGVSSDAIVQSNSGTTEVYDAIDAENDETERLTNSDSDFEKLVDELGTSTVVSGKLISGGGTVGEIARGRAVSFKTDTAEILVVFLFETAVDADNSENEVGEKLRADGLQNVDTELEAAMITAEGEVNIG